MQVLESARKKVAGLLVGIEQIEDAVLRGERRYQDKTFAVAYVDFADDVVGRAKGLRAFQERILGEGYFSSPGDLRWNKYIYIVAGPNSKQQDGFQEAKSAIEADEEYARKRVVSEDELESALGAAQYFTANDNVQEFDIVAEWGRKLAAAALDAVLDRPTRTTLIEQIGTGDARRLAISRKPLTLHQTDAPLNSTWLTKLRIEKFRPVHDGKPPYEFGQVTLITGPNGTGKTSLLEAIEYFYCGQNRRRGSSSSKVFATLCGSTLEMASTTDSTRLRARCLKWYNREERTSSGVLDGFDRYNFLDTDAAFRVTSELNAEALPEDLSRLVVGPEASQVWAYIGKLTPEVELARDRSLVKLEEAQGQLNDARTKLKALQERPSDAKALTDSFRASLSTMGWKASPSSSPFASAEEGTPLQAAHEHIQILLSAGTGLVNLRALKARWSQVDSAFIAAQAVDAARTAINERATGLAEQIRAYDAAAGIFERWALYVRSRFATLRAEYLQCKERVDRAADKIGIYASFDVPTVSPEFSDVRLIDAVNSAIQSVNSVASQVHSLEKLSSAYGQAAATRARVAQQLTTAVQASIAEGGAADICPVCKTKHTAEVLARHIESITADLEQPAELAAIAQQLSDAKNNLQGWKSWQSHLERIQHIATHFEMPQTSLCRDVLLALQNARNELNQANADLPIVKEKWLELERLGLTEIEYDRLLNSISAEVTVGQSPYDIDAVQQHLQAYKRASTSSREQLPPLQAELNSNASQLASLVSPLFSPSWQTRVAVGNDFQAVAALRQDLEALTKHADALCLQLDIADDMALSDVQASIAGALRALAEAVQAATHEQSASNDISALTEHISEIDKAVRALLMKHMNFRAAGEALIALAKELSLDRATKKSLDAIGAEINAAFVRIHSPNEYEYVGDGEVLLRSRESKETWSLDRVSTGQRSAFALSVFLALNRTAANAPPVVLIDDPVAHVDDLNALSFLDYLRDLAVHSKRQIFFATADTRIASLFARKFGFLGDDFKTIRLARDTEA
ncbi:AAA family ATPase [Acidovorax sp. ST3]|uniref:AAA family ATPase n=1 Tax=Acidovorax sp. ST3 TaxID=2219062 RepID=UPI000DA6768C|nr:AAA family ATPase [Acidovorax sp. ST3]